MRGARRRDPRRWVERGGAAGRLPPSRAGHADVRAEGHVPGGDPGATGADPAATVDLEAGAAWLEIRRLGDDVVWRALPPAEHAFRAALTSARTLEQAAEAALAVDGNFDLTGALSALFSEGL